MTLNDAPNHMNHARLCGLLVKVWKVLIALIAIGGLFCCVVPSAAHSIRSDPCHRAVVMLLYYTVRVLVKFAYESPCEFVVGNGLVIR